MENFAFDIWQANNSQKILKNKAYTKKPIKDLSVKLYGNETESVCFYITPKADVRSLRVSVADVSPSVQISVGYVLYVNVEKSSSGTHLDTGYYPDAVLQASVAETYGVNRIGAGENQEIRVNVKTDKKATAGEYQTQITVYVDGEKIVLPLTITVWDYVLPDENHTKQYFIIDDKHLRLVEDNTDFQAYRRYYEQLLDYRVNGSRMPFSLEQDYRAVVASYIDNLRRYYADGRINVFSVPVFYTQKFDDVDYERTEYSFQEVMKASLKDGVDYFKKSVTYLWILDEPHLTPAKIGYCKTVLPKFERLKDKISSECLKQAGDSELKKSVAFSVKNMPNVITSGVNGRILPQTPEEYYITWCPAFDSLSQNESCKMIQTLNKGEKWWYGCNWPVPPYPTYHIDDTYLSPRVLSWIQYAYGITGNLYWRVNYWARKENDELRYVDPYENITYPTTNGEGMLIYPGKKFGLDGFVPSVRLEAIRDGIEDFEALFALEQAFEENARRINAKSLSVNELLQPLYSKLFNKTIIVETACKRLEWARECVANMLVVAKKYAFVALDFDKASKKISFYADKDVQILGGTLTKRGSVYTATTAQDEIRLIFNGKEEIKLLFAETAYPKKYALSDCWAKTVEKYQIQDCYPENVVKPYYDVLDDETLTNKYPCCQALGSLISFVWKTETVIVKKKTQKGYQIQFTVPRGTFKTAEKYQTEILDEQAKRYTIATEGKTVTVQVENEKGKYTTELYVY